MRRILILLLLILFIQNTTDAQRRQRMNDYSGIITGKVVDSETDEPMEYANIVLFAKRDSSMVTGTVTNVEGVFTLELNRPGRFYMTADFMGFEKSVLDTVTLMPPSKALDLGVIRLERATYQIDEVNVEGERLPFEYRIDKKIINVDQQLTTVSGSAVDALQNSPSITVDIDGNVFLRGSQSFTVLIDGRPTILDGNDALEQIPATSIKNIELITNPSAKYDPEGTAGIINVILKKNSLQGLSGISNVNLGTFYQHGVDVAANYRVDDFVFTISANYNKRKHPGTIDRFATTITPEKTFKNEFHGDRDGERTHYDIKFGIDYNLTESDIFMIGTRYGGREGGHDREMDISEWNSIDQTWFHYNSDSDEERNGTFFSSYAGYEHLFDSQSHKLTLRFEYGTRDFEELSISEDFLDDGTMLVARKYSEEGPDTEYEIKADYYYEMDKDNILEIGMESEFESENEESKNYYYDYDINQYIFRDEYSHESDFKDNTHAAYVTFASQIDDFGIKLGLRGEYTDRKMTLVETNQSFIVDKMDYFPTVHTSYNIAKGTQLMASYSRRIQRPRGWYLEPFETWMNENNLRIGNPELEPEYIDAYEVGFAQHFESTSFSLEGYYHLNKNNIEHVHTPYEDDVMLHTFVNIGEVKRIGVEAMINIMPTEWWNMNIMGSYFNVTQTGELFGESYDTEENNWNTRFMTMFRIFKGLTLQMHLRYDPPSKTIQGEREEQFMTDAAFNYDIIEKTLSTTLQIRDIFSTGKYEFTSVGSNFDSYTKFTRTAPSVMLTFTYKLNNYKNGKDRDGDGFEMEEGEM